MSTAGMDEAAGQWMAHVGIPANSGVSGAVLGALPGQAGIEVFSPALDAVGNSVRGVLAFERMSEDLNLHVMEAGALGGTVVRFVRRGGPAEPRVPKWEDEVLGASEGVASEHGDRVTRVGLLLVSEGHQLCLPTVGRWLRRRGICRLRNLSPAGQDLRRQPAQRITARGRLDTRCTWT